MKKLPFALAMVTLTAVFSVGIAACDVDAAEHPIEPPATVVSPYPSASVSASPVVVPSTSVSVSPSVSVSTKVTDTNQNDVPGDGGR